MARKDGGEGLPRAPWRRRALVLLLAVVTAWAIVLALTRHVESKRERPAPSPPLAVGGKAEVLLVAPGASTPR